MGVEARDYRDKRVGKSPVCPDYDHDSGMPRAGVSCDVAEGEGEVIC